MLDGFGTVVNTLGKSCDHSMEDLPLTVSNAGICVKPYLTQIVTTILWRLNNKSAKVRQQATNLTT
jgi:splicing factor 3B subunit 1